VRTALENGQRTIDDQNYEAAISFFDYALTFEPDNVTAKNGVAEAHIQATAQSHWDSKAVL